MKFYVYLRSFVVIILGNLVASYWRYLKKIKYLEYASLVELGVLIIVENFLVVLAAVRNKSLRENTHYNLVISLSVCDFVVGLSLIMYGSVIAPNNDTDQTAIHIVCNFFYCVMVVTYLMSLLQTFCISLNRYLVIKENKLSQTFWNGNRKYFVFFVLLLISLICNVSILFTTKQGCDIQHVIGDKKSLYNVFVSSTHLLIFSFTFIIYFLTLWNIWKMHRKTASADNEEQRRRNIRKRKRILKSMKVVSFILLTLAISVVPAAVIGLKGVSSQSELLALILSACSNSAVNPVIYCTQIKELYKEIKTMFSIHI